MKTCLLSIALLLLVGCAPYPRYRTDAESTLRETQPSDRFLSTNEYIRFGSILQKYLGKPYKGRSQWDSGLDCSKFTSDVFRDFNKTILPRKSADQYQVGEEVPRNRLKYGDLVFFRTERDRISHVGVYVGHNGFIHASTSRGVIISNLSE